MKSLHGRGKQKARQKNHNSHKGLNEAKGFKAGMMKIQPQRMKKGRSQKYMGNSRKKK
jgi:hypothetical protein